MNLESSQTDANECDIPVSMLTEVVSVNEQNKYFVHIHSDLNAFSEDTLRVQLVHALTERKVNYSKTEL